MATEISLPCSQEPTIYTYIEPDKSSRQPGLFFLLYFNIIIKSACSPVMQPLSFRHSTKSCMYSSSLPCVLCAPHTSYYLIGLTLGNSYLVVRQSSRTSRSLSFKFRYVEIPIVLSFQYGTAYARVNLSKLHSIPPPAWYQVIIFLCFLTVHHNIDFSKYQLSAQLF